MRQDEDAVGDRGRGAGRARRAALRVLALGSHRLLRLGINGTVRHIELGGTRAPARGLGEAMVTTKELTTSNATGRGVLRDLAMASIGGGVMLASLLTLASCASSPAGDPLARARRALADTESTAVRTEGEAGETVRAAVERFQALFADFSPATIRERARSVYAEGAYFNDGFAELEGIDAIEGYLTRSAEAAGEVDIEIHDVAYSGAEIYLRWDMRFTNAKGSKEVVAPGVSHLRVDGNGLVVFHRDYWDSSGALAEFVPLMPSILRSIRSHL